MAIRREKNWTAVNAQLKLIVREAVGASAVTWQNELVTMLSRPGRGRYYARSSATRKLAVNKFGELDAATVHFLKTEEARRVTRAAERGRKVATRPLRGIGIHRASAPGDPPAVDTGHLRRSMQVDASRLNQQQPTARIGTNVEYARGLEYGTRSIAPRPYFRPSVPKARPKVLSIFRTMLARVGRVR